MLLFHREKDVTDVYYISLSLHLFPGKEINLYKPFFGIPVSLGMPVLIPVSLGIPV